MADSRRIEETVVEGHRLGRHVHHDPRSLAYRVKPDGTVASKRWTRVAAVFDQGDLGSCTGNAMAGVLGTAPFYGTVPNLTVDENLAVDLYSLATSLDSYPGQYKPTDTGSDGLSVAKGAQQKGYISGYQHITSVAAAQTAIQAGPFIVGSDWYDGFDNPDQSGLVKISGSVRGGHEYECVGYNATEDVWEFCNSWGTSWGVAGRFFYSSGTFAALLAKDGDATVPVPVTAPAPVPTPTPQPGDVADAALVAAMDPWERTIVSRISKAGKAKAGYDAWKKARGY